MNSRTTETLGAVAVGDRAGRRACLRMLDACLHHLEDANERDEQAVDEALAGRLPAAVGVRAGMPICDAIERVMRAQERYLRPEPDMLAGDEDESGEAPGLTAADARDLTARIRAGGAGVCARLLEAYERRAAAALGYVTWPRYVKEELDLSRSRSYELLDHARVVRALGAAAGLADPPEISPYAARQVKPHLDALVAVVRDRTAAAPPELREEIVRRAVDEHRARLQAAPCAPAPCAAGPCALDAASLTGVQDAIDRLASLPPAAELVDRLRDGGIDGWANAVAARRWLDDLVDQLRVTTVPPG